VSQISACKYGWLVIFVRKNGRGSMILPRFFAPGCCDPLHRLPGWEHSAKEPAGITGRYKKLFSIKNLEE